jgi:hypothetical protein
MLFHLDRYLVCVWSSREIQAIGHAGTEVAVTNTSNRFFTARSTFFLGGSPSHVSTGQCPYIPSLHLSKVWRPIAFR